MLVGIGKRITLTDIRGNKWEKRNDQSRRDKENRLKQRVYDSGIVCKKEPNYRISSIHLTKNA